jgi:hypothetical protein
LALSYCAAIYGGREGLGKEADLVSTEWWFKNNYDQGRRLAGALNPRSLL